MRKAWRIMRPSAGLPGGCRYHGVWGIDAGDAIVPEKIMHPSPAAAVADATRSRSASGRNYLSLPEAVAGGVC